MFSVLYIQSLTSVLTRPTRVVASKDARPAGAKTARPVPAAASAGGWPVLLLVPHGGRASS